MANTKKNNKFNTARGIAIFPKTHQAVRWDEKLNRSVPDPAGSFECNVAFDPGPAVDQLKAVIKECAAEANIKPKNLPYKMEEDEDGNETGRFLFKFKQYGTDRDGNSRRIPHWDIKGKPLGEDFRLTSGSTVKLSGRPQAYKQLGGGVRFLFDAVQVINFVPYESNPFEDESGEEDGGETTGENQDAPFDAEDDPTDF